MEIEEVADLRPEVVAETPVEKGNADNARMGGGGGGRGQ